MAQLELELPRGMHKVTDLPALRPLFHDGMSVMIAGFLGCGTPERLVSFILDEKIKDIHLIVNDTAFHDKGAGRLIAAGNEVVTQVTCCHIGTNKITRKRFLEGSLKVNFIPQGTLVEMIRAKGYGLGGVITPTGVGTEIAEGKQLITMNGKEYIVEPPLGADVTLIKADAVDTFGNATYRATARNYNTTMAMAGDVVICEAAHIVAIGEMNPNDVHTPGNFIDFIVEGK